MKSKTFTFLGSTIIILGIIDFVFVLPGTFRTFRNVVSAHPWKSILTNYLGTLLGGYFFFSLMSLVFILLGIYYLRIGIKKREANKLIFTSAIFQMIALIIGTVGLVGPLFSQDPGASLLTLILGLPTLILMGIGIILMIIGWVMNSSRHK